MTTGLIFLAMARAAHPGEDHLSPLILAVSAAGDHADAGVDHLAEVTGAIIALTYRLGQAQPQQRTAMASA